MVIKAGQGIRQGESQEIRIKRQDVERQDKGFITAEGYKQKSPDQCDPDFSVIAYFFLVS